MKTMAIAEVKKMFNQVVREAQDEDIIVTRHGRPVVRVSGVSGEDIVDIAATDSSFFRRAVAARGVEPTISGEEMWARLGVPAVAKRGRHRRG